MMKVLDYANDIKRSVEEVLSKCKQLNIKVTNADDMLEEEHVIDLDNAFAADTNNEINSADVEEEEIDEEQLEDIISTVKLKVDDTIKIQKLKKKADMPVEDFASKRKEMYKHKEKLQANTPNQQDNVLI